MAMDLGRGFQLGSIAVEPVNGYVVGPDREPRHLAPKAMEVLVNLAADAPETVTRDRLLDRVWGRRYVSDEVLTHAITEIRHVLDDNPGHPEYIETIPKRGYRLLKLPVALEASVDDPGWRPHSAGMIRRYPIIAILMIAGITVGSIAMLDPFSDTGYDRLGLVQDKPRSAPGNTNSIPRAVPQVDQNESNALYLQARSLVRQVTADSTRRAQTLLEQLLTADSHNALAWDLLGRIYFRQAALFRTRPLREGSELARQAIQRALAIDPLHGPAHADLAFVNLTFDYDFDGAYRQLRQAQDLTPADPHVLRIAARLEMTHNHLDHAIEMLERSVELDPKSCVANSDLGQAYYFAHRLEEAESSLEMALVLNPDAARSRYLLGLVWLAQKKARPALIAMEEEIDEGFRLIGTAIARHSLGDDAASNEALAAADRTLGGSGPYQVARAYAFRGQREEALDWLELAYEDRDGDLTYLLVDPLLAELQSEQRWTVLVEKLGLAERT